MTREERMKLNEQKFIQIEKAYGPNYGKFNEAYINDNELYFEDSFSDLFSELPEGKFTGEYEIIRSFIGDYLQTGVAGKAILNFASAKYPGGGVRHGSIAQEEDICRNSTLYFYMQNYDNSHYKPGKFVGNNHLLDDFIIYSKDVPTVKPDMTLGATNDYITSAAPDLRLMKDVAYRGMSNEVIHRARANQAQELRRTWIYRIMGVLGAAVKNEAQELVLGPWGCGVFMNDPELVASSFESMLDYYGSYFTKITFLVPDDTNYEKFKRFETKNK